MLQPPLFMYERTAYKLELKWAIVGVELMLQPF